MRGELFRKEALDHRQQRGLGDVVLITSPSAVYLGLMATLIAVLVVVFAWQGEFTRKAHVNGYLTPEKGLIKVYTPVVGTVIESQISEGRQVTKGDVLLVISTDRNSLDEQQVQGKSIALLEKRRASMQMDLESQQGIDDLKLRVLNNRLLRFKEELAAVGLSIEIQQERLNAAVKMTQRYEELETKHYVTASQVQQQKDVVLELRGRLQDLQRDKLAIEGEITALNLEIATIGLESKQNIAAIERQIHSLEQELTLNESNRHIVITAPTDGMVTTILVEKGQQASLTVPILSIIPNGSVLEAQLLVPSRAIGFVESGQSVAMRYQAFPYQRFGHYRGVINEISKTMVTPAEAELPFPVQEAGYLVTVALDEQVVNAYGKDLSLQPGMLIDADIHFDRRTIIQWILDPLFSLVKGV